MSTSPIYRLVRGNSDADKSPILDRFNRVDVEWSDIDTSDVDRSDIDRSSDLDTCTVSGGPISTDGPMWTGPIDDKNPLSTGSRPLRCRQKLDVKTVLTSTGPISTGSIYQVVRYG